MKTRVSLKYLVNDCLWKTFFDSNSPQAPSNLTPLTILVTLIPFTLFSPTMRAINLQKGQKFALIDHCFFDLFTELEIWY